MATQTEEIERLKAFTEKLQKLYEDFYELLPCDLILLTPAKEEQRKAEAEEIARIADKYGFDGSLFQELFPVEDHLSIRQAKRLTKKIETIPRIIAAIEKPVDKSAIPRDVALLTVSQVATMLGWGESVVRQRNREGLLPEPYRFGGTIQWGRKELESWISAGCPNRQQWEQQKKSKPITSERINSNNLSK
jgi:predicted DNA-binding transcriptional regulator AlpA